MYTIIISFYVTRTWRTFVLTTTCTIANIVDHDVRPESDDIGMEALNSWKWCKMQYLSFWHLARIQLEESEGNSTETLSKDPKKLTVISIAVLPATSMERIVNIRTQLLYKWYHGPPTSNRYKRRKSDFAVCAISS